MLNEKGKENGRTTSTKSTGRSLKPPRRRREKGFTGRYTRRRLLCAGRPHGRCPGSVTPRPRISCTRPHAGSDALWTRDTRPLGTVIPVDRGDLGLHRDGWGLGRAHGHRAGGEAAEGCPRPRAGPSGCARKPPARGDTGRGQARSQPPAGGASLSQRLRRHSDTIANVTPNGRARPASPSSKGKPRAAKPSPCD